MKEKKKRFTVSLPKTDYQKLVNLADQARPRLKFNYVVEWAILRLLDMANDPKLQAEIGNPIKKGTQNEN